MPEKSARTLFPDKFPFLLKQIPDPPKSLNIKGALPDENFVHLAVIGSRRFSSYGKEVCEKLIFGLKDYNIAIVSGMALGIDSIAHQAALKNKMKTVAVLGSGLNPEVIYPQANYRLSQEIIGAGGCLISEYPHEMKAAQYTFPQRNRIVAGLCAGILVIEAAERSGALITAFLGLEYNREVFAVPGNIFSTNSRGANNLLKMGAMPITQTADILRALGIAPNKNELQIHATLSPLEEKIISSLYEPTERDELIRNLSLPPKEINPVLMQMEIRGIIKNIGGKFYTNL